MFLFIFCGYAVSAFCAENAYPLVQSKLYQPKPLTYFAGYKLALDYKNKSELEQKDTIKRWMKVLPEDAWKKIVFSDPLSFLRFEKADWFVSSQGSIDSKSSSGLTWVRNTSAESEDRRVYSVMSNQQKKLIKKVELNNLLPLWMYISDAMLVWALNDQSTVHIFDFISQSEQTFNLGVGYHYCIPSDSEQGVLYLFDSVIGDIKKTLTKVCCNLDQSGKFTIQQLDVSHFLEAIACTTFIQTQQLDKYLLCNGETVYEYNTLEGIIKPINLPFNFDHILHGTDSFKVIVYSKKNDDVGACWRVFSIDNLQLPLYQIVTRKDFTRFLKLDLEDRLIFYKNGMLYDSFNNSTLKLDYEPHGGIDLSRGGAPMPNSISVFRDKDKNYYIMTDVFTLQKQSDVKVSASNQNN